MASKVLVITHSDLDNCPSLSRIKDFISNNYDSSIDDVTVLILFSYGYGINVPLDLVQLKSPLLFTQKMYSSISMACKLCRCCYIKS